MTYSNPQIPQPSVPHSQRPPATLNDIEWQLNKIHEEIRRLQETQRSQLDALEKMTSAPQKVTVQNVDMPFPDIVAFMVTWAVAAIPAAIILTVLGGLLFIIGASLLNSL